MSKTWKWFVEYSHPTQAHMYGVESCIYSGETRYQKVDILQTEFFGRCLVLDGKIQSSEFDEYIYHETLVHPAMVAHQKAQKVLVAGGGEGGALREILKYPSIKKLVMVDIDEEVVQLCRRFLPAFSGGAFDEPRVEVLFQDARKYLEESDEKWDIIFVDITDPLDDSPAYLLFTREFYEIAAAKLNRGGCIALQSGNLNPRLIRCHSAVINTLNLVFKHVDSYGSYIPSFDTRWGFAFASNDYSAAAIEAQKVDDVLLKNNISDLRFYDGMTHIHMFSITKDLRTLCSKDKRIIEDSKPLTVYR